MNIKHLSSLTAISAIALSAAIPAFAETSTSSEVTFSCEVKDGIPATVLQTEDAQTTIFNWQSDYLSQNKNPLDLCNEVTAKLNSYSADDSNDLSKLTFKADVMEEMPVVCATNNPESCDKVLFLLSPTEEKRADFVANNVLDDILDKNLQANTTKVESRQRGLQSVSHSINIWELILGRKITKTF